MLKSIGAGEKAWKGKEASRPADAGSVMSGPPVGRVWGGATSVVGGARPVGTRCSAWFLSARKRPERCDVRGVDRMTLVVGAVTVGRCPFAFHADLVLPGNGGQTLCVFSQLPASSPRPSHASGGMTGGRSP